MALCCVTVLWSFQASNLQHEEPKSERYGLYIYRMCWLRKLIKKLRKRSTSWDHDGGIILLDYLWRTWPNRRWTGCRAGAVGEAHKIVNNSTTVNFDRTSCTYLSTSTYTPTHTNFIIIIRRVDDDFFIGYDKRNNFISLRPQTMP